MIKKILIVIITISTLIANAQDEIDALRYSTQNVIGTARYSAMAGAFGSLGGDFSSLSANPAGIGMYQLSEFTFTPSFNLNSTKSYYNNSHLSSHKSNTDISSLGLVSTIVKSNSDWKRINIGIGWNQLADYNNTIDISGVNNSSIVDDIISITNGTLREELYESGAYSEMAWETYLIDPLFDENGVVVDGEYISNFSSNTKAQSKLINSIGNMHEFLFSIGGSYQEKLYVGVTLGVPTFNYYEYSEYNEHEIIDTVNNLRGMLLTEEKSAYGTGYNLKFGAIYRVSDNIKVGGALQSPTFFNIEEDYNTSISTLFRDSVKSWSMGYLHPVTYTLITPLKANISTSTIVNRSILISAEYELIDYSSAKYLTTDLERNNETITALYQKTHNIKLGVEMNIKPFILRAGYCKYESPTPTQDFSRENFSFGIGLNNGMYFFDATYVLSQSIGEHLLYDEEYISPITLVNTDHNLLFTVGFRY